MQDAVRLGLEFLILTATRTNEVQLATWPEIDLDDEDVDDSRRPHEERPRTSRPAVGSSRRDPRQHVQALGGRVRLSRHRSPTSRSRT